jgi:DNA-directed RNA polymerase subunit RPC12/RpoP
MFKNMIAPVQAWLLSQGKCVGCGKELPRKQGSGLVQVTCPCGRVYMYDPTAEAYRRATLEEIK